MTEKLRQLTIEYLSATDKLIANRKFGEGLFGMPDSARSSPVHTEFYNAMEATVKELAGDAPDSETAEALVRFLLTAVEKFPCSKLAEWMLLAIQNHALPLIPFLSPESKAEIFAWYNKAYPRMQRLPGQQKIAKALKK